MSLRSRFILAFLMIVMVTLAVVSITIRLGAKRQVDVVRARGGWIGAEELILDLQSYYQEHGSWQGVEALLETHNLGMANHGMGQGGSDGQGRQTGGNRPGIRLADAQGDVVYDPDNPSGGTLPKESLDGGIALKEGNRTIGYLLPLEGQQFIGSEFDEQLLQAVNRASLYAALIAGGLALLLALLLATFLLRPVQQLSEAAGSMAAGDLGKRVPAAGGGELAALGRAFNHMAGSLQAAEQRRQAMTTDIAHELRTPLSVQRANLEAMLDDVYPLEKVYLEKVLDQNSLLTRLVQDLRTLTLADEGALQLEVTAVHLNDLVNRAAERFQTQAGRKNIRISVHPAQSTLMTQADPQRLEQILNNLLDNALHHTPEGGRVEISFSRENGKAVVQVHDSGPGIPEDALPYLFERFYRVDKGRAREAGGSGLGLSIARKLAEVHGGSLEAANHPEGGAVFVLSIPLSAFRNDNSSAAFPG